MKLWNSSSAILLTICWLSNLQKDSLKKPSVPVTPSFCTAIRAISTHRQAAKPYLENSTRFKACQEPELPETMLSWKVFSVVSWMSCAFSSFIGSVTILTSSLNKLFIISIMNVLFASLTVSHLSNLELIRSLNPAFSVDYLLTISVP